MAETTERTPPADGYAGDAPHPLAIAALALAAGFLLARAIAWRSHAHPR